MGASTVVASLDRAHRQVYRRRRSSGSILSSNASRGSGGPHLPMFRAGSRPVGKGFQRRAPLRTPLHLLEKLVQKLKFFQEVQSTVLQFSLEPHDSRHPRSGRRWNATLKQADRTRPMGEAMFMEGGRYRWTGREAVPVEPAITGPPLS